MKQDDANGVRWDSGQYLKFAAERTQPCRDLANRIALEKVHTAIDLGCGPGNSARVLREHWPEADITGLDSSEEMIAAARKDYPGGRWVIGDIAEWAAARGGVVDLIFSNAALHWAPNHEELYPRLMARTSGALAVQMPGNLKGAMHQRMREMALSPAWRDSFGKLRDSHVGELDFYYDLLSPIASRVELWATEYVHVLPDAEAIIEWYKGTGLRPYLQALDSDADRDRFIAEYLAEIRMLYKPQSDGRVLFPFRRVFILAYR